MFDKIVTGVKESVLSSSIFCEEKFEVKIMDLQEGRLETLPKNFQSQSSTREGVQHLVDDITRRSNN